MGPPGPQCQDVSGARRYNRERKRERVCTGARQYEQAIDTNTIIHPWWLYTENVLISRYLDPDDV